MATVLPKVKICIVFKKQTELVNEIKTALTVLKSKYALRFYEGNWKGCSKDYHLAILVPSSDEVEKALEFLEIPANSHTKAVPLLPPETELPEMVKFLEHKRVDQALRTAFQWRHDLAVIIHVLASGEIFGMEKYLSDEDTVSYLRFNDYEGRQEVLQKVRDVAAEMGLRRVRREHSVQAAEELVMNALYNAPRYDDGSMMFGNIDPHKRVSMGSPKPVSLRYSQTANGLFMSVRDRFGALDKETVLQYIKKCLYSPDQIDRKTIGAGLGIFLTMRRVQSYIVNVAPNVATEVIINLKQTKDLGVPATIAFFEYPNE